MKDGMRGQKGFGPHTDPKSMGPWEGPKRWEETKALLGSNDPSKPSRVGLTRSKKKDKVLRFAASSSNKKNPFSFCRFMTHFHAEKPYFLFYLNDQKEKTN